MYHAESFTLQTRGRGTYEISRQVQRIVESAGIARGLCTVFIHHTSASLIVCENAAPEVRADLDRFFARLVPDGDPLFEHTDEGDDDMAAHVRSILTLTSISVPVEDSRCDLGTWQGIYVWEHRWRAHSRRITVSIVG